MDPIQAGIAGGIKGFIFTLIIASLVFGTVLLIKASHWGKMQWSKANVEKKKVVLIVSAVLCALMLLYPPFIEHGVNTLTRNLGYGFIFSPPSGYTGDGEVNVSLLLAQWLAVAACGGVAYLLFRGTEKVTDGAEAKSVPVPELRDLPTPSGALIEPAATSSTLDPYAAALAEVTNGHPDASIWARALVDADGNRDVAIARYIKNRAEQLTSAKSESQKTEEPVRVVEDSPEVFAKDQREGNKTDNGAVVFVLKGAVVFVLVFVVIMVFFIAYVLSNRV